MNEPQFLEAADRIGARLCRDAIWSGNQCNWLGWSLEVVGRSWALVYKAQTPFLYDGTAGIALFLARLSRLTGDKLQRDTAIGGLNRSFAALPDIFEEMRPSVYSGGAGIAYAAIECGSALNDEAMVRRGLLSLDSAASSPPNEKWLDIIGGSAGTIQVLLDAAFRCGNHRLAERAQDHGNMLLRAAVKSDNGWSWDTLPGQTTRHLLGYGHGAAGIGCALLELWSATGETNYRRAALEAFRYEDSNFSPNDHNWPDLRPMDGYGVPAGQQVFAAAWCHGGPGIGLSRLRALELLGDSDGRLSAGLAEALLTTSAACSQNAFQVGGNMSLCHGIGGNADLLIATARSQNRADLREIAENAGREAISRIQTNDLPWPCGVNGGGETPNLMLGLAGIGHFFLRLHDPVDVPSILLLSRAVPAAKASGAAA